MDDLAGILTIVREEIDGVADFLTPHAFDTVYPAMLAGALEARGLGVRRQVRIKVAEGEKVHDTGQVIDIYVEDVLPVLMYTRQDLGQQSPGRLLGMLGVLGLTTGLMVNLCASNESGRMRVISTRKPRMELIR